MIDGKPDRLGEMLMLLERSPEEGNSVPGIHECLRLIKLFMEIGDANDRRILLELIERFAENSSGNRATY